MKKYILTIMLSIVYHGLFAQKSGMDTLLVQTKIYCDHCKECESCKPRIEHELSFTKGVKSYTVNTDSQIITVVYNSKKTNPQAIREAIANCGFDADDVKAGPKAVAKLDGCCQPK